MVHFIDYFLKLGSHVPHPSSLFTLLLIFIVRERQRERENKGETDQAFVH